MPDYPMDFPDLIIGGSLGSQGVLGGPGVFRGHWGVLGFIRGHPGGSSWGHLLVIRVHGSHQYGHRRHFEGFGGILGALGGMWGSIEVCKGVTLWNIQGWVGVGRGG